MGSVAFRGCPAPSRRRLARDSRPIPGRVGEATIGQVPQPGATSSAAAAAGKLRPMTTRHNRRGWGEAGSAGQLAGPHGSSSAERREHLHGA
jgi:hypothetical protein